MAYASSGCILSACGCVLSLLVVGLVIIVGSDAESMRQGALVVLLIILFVALAIAGRRPPEAGVWKCNSCGEPNSEDLGGCAACGEHRE